jgi:peptide deformylase
MLDGKSDSESQGQLFNAEDPCHSDFSPSTVVTGIDASDKSMHLLGMVFTKMLHAVILARKVKNVVYKKVPQTVRDVFFTFCVVLLLYLAVRQYTERNLRKLKAEKDEMATCNVCVDTTKTPVAPCKWVSINDFTIHRKKLNLFTKMMSEHVNHENGPCIDSFHIGFETCAIAYKGKFSNSVMLNPIEVEADWNSSTPRVYQEWSDQFPGVSLKRVRPNSVTIVHVVEKEGVIRNETMVISGKSAACICHVLEILNGTHAELYLKEKSENRK